MDHFWGEFYFYVVSALAVAGALITVLNPNPIRGAMGLLTMIVSLAGLFLALHAQFLAAIQLIVYAGAIVVLFLFVIMLLGPDATPPHDSRGRFSRTVGGGLFILSAMGAMAAIVHGGLRFALPAVDQDFGSIDQFGRVLFSYGVVPFELSSALLMVAVLGAVGVARGKDNRGKAKVEGGPLGAATTQPGSEGGAAARFVAGSTAHGPGDFVPRGGE